jgi:MFS family permease
MSEGPLSERPLAERSLSERRSAPTKARAVAPRPAVVAVFFALGATAGVWAARIPAIKAGLHLSPGTLGLVLLGPAIGSVLALPAAGAVLTVIAPRRVVQLGVLAIALLQPLTTFAGSAFQLFLVLAGWGAGIGVIDVAMNIEAAAVQEHLGRTTMSSFHAAYSVGGLAGAGSGAIAAAAAMSDRTNFMIGAVVILITGAGSAQLFASRPARDTTQQGAGERGAGQRGTAQHGTAQHGTAQHGAGERGSEQHRPASRWPTWSWTLACLAFVAFGSFLAEGAASDWSAVYLHSSLGAPAGVAAVGYTVFSLAMVGGRLAGDRLTDRFGPARLVRVSAGIASVGFLGALLAGRVGVGLVGFGLLGAGLSVVVPTVFTAASRLGLPGPNLAAVTSTGYLGMLIGPALIGGLAEAVGLPAALGTLVAITGITSVLGGVVRTRTTPTAGRAPAGAIRSGN